VFHVAAFLNIILQMKFFGGESVFRKATLFIGIISFMCIFGDVGLLSDIGKESQYGWDVKGEWIVLYLSLIPQLVFYFFMFITAISGLRLSRNVHLSDRNVRDETVFYAVHYTGLLCGGIGLLQTVTVLFIRTTITNLKLLVIYYNTFILAPYCLIALYWLFMKFREKPAEWYDEKQFQDISKAGFLTLLVVLPFMTVFYLTDYTSPGGPAGVLWFPFLINIIIASFSGATLYMKEN